MIIRNFKFSGVENIDGYSLGLLSSEDGKDWYESQELFDSEKLKFEFDNNGVISRLSMDVSELWPVDRSVAEMSLSEVPEGINEKGEWQFDGKKIIAIPIDYEALAMQEKTEKLKEAADMIAPLQDAVDLGVATDDESQKLYEWKTYRIGLNRFEFGDEWPIKPDI